MAEQTSVETITAQYGTLPGKKIHLALKRLLDVLTAVLALVVLTLLLPLLALAIKLDSRGPVFFRQRRIGAGGKPFTILKFRTMYVDADDEFHRRAVAKLAAGEPTVMANGRTSFKPREDPRLTRAGRFLRDTGLDEWPQAINVLRGDMSIVGPRPAILYELQYYKEWCFKRFAVRPGITGLWQVRRHHTSDLDQAMRLDTEYVDSLSLWLDLKIILMTIPRIFLRGWAF